LYLPFLLSQGNIRFESAFETFYHFNVVHRRKPLKVSYETELIRFVGLPI